MRTEDMKILIIEDEEDQRIRLKYVLESEGYQVEEAESGDEAVKLINQKDKYYNLIITDLKMPGDTDGEGVLLKARKVSPKTAIIIVTAYGSVDSAVRAMMNGAFDYIQKPLNIPELRIKIERVLQIQEMTTQLESNGVDEANSKVFIQEINDKKEKLTEINQITKNILSDLANTNELYSDLKKISSISEF